MVVWVHGDSNSLTTSATPAQFFGARRNVDVYYSASLAETVGIFWFWKPSEVMI